LSVSQGEEIAMMMEIVSAAHGDDLLREAQARNRLVALGVLPRRRPLRDRLRSRFAQRAAAPTREPGAIAVHCAHAAAVAARSLPRGGTSFFTTAAQTR
jgi:hypothetical protein